MPTLLHSVPGCREGASWVTSVWVRRWRKARKAVAILLHYVP